MTWWLNYGCLGGPRVDCGGPGGGCSPWARGAPMVVDPYAGFSGAKPPWSACPRFAVAGACCQGCATGQGCDDKKRMVGASHVGETAIPWDEVLASNATIEHVQEAAAKLAGSPAGSPELQRYMLWSLFYTTWTIWFSATKASVEADWLVTGLTFGNKILHGDNADQYKALILSFNEQLKALEALHVQASAAPIDTRSPAGKAFDDTITGVLGGASGALGAVTTGLTWLAIAGVVGLGLYFGAPLLLSRLSA